MNYICLNFILITGIPFQKTCAIWSHPMISLTTCMVASLMAVITSTKSFPLSPIFLRASPKIKDQTITPKVFSPSIWLPTRRTSVVFWNKMAHSVRTMVWLGQLTVSSAHDDGGEGKTAYHIHTRIAIRCFEFNLHFLSLVLRKNNNNKKSEIWHSLHHMRKQPTYQTPSNKTYLLKARQNQILWHHVPIENKQNFKMMNKKRVRVTN